MLLAKDKGWDTFPMIEFDPDEVKQIFKILQNYEIVLMISMGKENTIKQRMTGYRRHL
nr:nitroreductase family protein [Clostridium sporogenes]